jgi:hypothetical protein
MASDYRTQIDLPRGIRNNNPGNIKAGDSWQGSAGDDGTFVIFADMSWGTRALATALANMQNRGLNTIRSIVSAWAPASENNTQAYVTAVANDTGIGPDDTLAMDQPTLAAIMRAIINHENGEASSLSYVSDQDIQEGLNKMNSGLLSVFPAAVVAAQQNPGTTAGLVIGGALILLILLNRD